LQRLLRWSGLLAYGVVLAGIFGCAGYLSFSLFVRRGVTKVPAVTARSAEEADRLLADHGLTVRRRDEADRYDEGIPRGRVRWQNPGAGSLVKRGSPVQIAFSLGPQEVAVPDLRGLTLQEAHFALAGVGLGIGRTVRVFSSGFSRGAIAEQEPPPGGSARPDQAVDLYLSQGALAERYVMPDLVYRRYTHARAFLEGRGFRFGSIKYEPYEGVEPGIVLRQAPLPGHPLVPEDGISIVVAAAATAP
jgi:serine/threonine-protein kinase